MGEEGNETITRKLVSPFNYLPNGSADDPNLTSLPASAFVSAEIHLWSGAPQLKAKYRYPLGRIYFMAGAHSIIAADMQSIVRGQLYSLVVHSPHCEM
jgi:hypothetical protein